MKYIENIELREWVKDNLKKTIFQKAHALAVQTGCQILVKLHDDVDITQHQYYATDRLRKVFRYTGLREQPGEKFVSGVTGEPLIDQAVQSDQYDGLDPHTSCSTGTSSAQISTDVVDNVARPSSDANEVDGQGEDRMKSEVEDGHEESAVPMHLAMTCETSEDTSLDAVQTERPPEQESSGVDKGGGDVLSRVKIKEEPMDDSNQDDGTTSTFQDQELDTTDATSQSNTQVTNSSQFESTTQAPSTSQYLSSLAYQVPATPKPYQCAMCGKAFRSVQVLQKHTHTFHMKTQHVMGVRTGKGRGRGRPPLIPPGPRFQQLGTSSTHSNSFTCVMCNISFPDVEILHDHMSRTHLGAAATSSAPSHTGESPDNPEYSTPGTSQQATAFPSPSSDKPAAQGSPYGQQPGTSSSVPVFSKPVSLPSGSRTATSAGTARMGLGKFRRGPHSPGPITVSSIMTAILLTTGPVNNCSSFLHSGPTHMRQVVTVEEYTSAARELQKVGMGELMRFEVSRYTREIFVKKAPKEAEVVLARHPELCDPLVYALRYFMPLPSKFRPKMREKLVQLGIVTEEQVYKASSF